MKRQVDAVEGSWQDEDRVQPVDAGAVDDLSPQVPVPAVTEERVKRDPAPNRVQPADKEAVEDQSPKVPVTIMAEAQGLWRLEWKDADGRLRQSWSRDRLETSTLAHLASLPPHGDDIESVLVDICIPVSDQVTTLHFMNIWEISKITYQAMRDLLTSYSADEYIALEARVQALGAKANNPGGYKWPI